MEEGRKHGGKMKGLVKERGGGGGRGIKRPVNGPVHGRKQHDKYTARVSQIHVLTSLV